MYLKSLTLHSPWTTFSIFVAATTVHTMPSMRLDCHVSFAWVYITILIVMSLSAVYVSMMTSASAFVSIAKVKS